jgi:transposase
MMRTPMRVTLSEQDRLTLNRWVKSRAIGEKQKLRAQLVLMAADGIASQMILKTLKISAPTLSLWRQRYLDKGLEGLKKGKTRPSRVPPLPVEKVQEVLTLTMTGKLAHATHWSCRTLAQQVGISRMVVHRIWREHALKPNRVKGFKVSNDPQFEAKLRDVVGLYLDPPEKAIVFSVDEKSQIQALDRTQPGLPMKPGKNGTMTHDYKRHGTTTLFAALNVHEGTVIGECLPKHRNDEFLRFLKKLDRHADKHLAIHVIVDNYATHKHPNVKTWLAKHPRFHFHFTPTSASWLNLVERFFRDITEERIRRGVCHSVDDLKAAIMDYLDHRNDNPKPYHWTASPEAIIRKVIKAKNTLRTLH